MVLAMIAVSLPTGDASAQFNQTRRGFDKWKNNAGNGSACTAAHITTNNQVNRLALCTSRCASANAACTCGCNSCSGSMDPNCGSICSGNCSAKNTQCISYCNARYQ
jgi:hypothetical protein